MNKIISLKQFNFVDKEPEVMSYLALASLLFNIALGFLFIIKEHNTSKNYATRII
jgi:hypothetical protein